MNSPRDHEGPQLYDQLRSFKEPHYVQTGKEHSYVLFDRENDCLELGGGPMPIVVLNASCNPTFEIFYDQDNDCYVLTIFGEVHILDAATTRIGFTRFFQTKYSEVYQ